jgi:hypothetical protein
MLSEVLGWILVVLGIASYIVALAILVKQQLLKEETVKPSFTNLDLGTIGDLLKHLTNAIESFSRLSLPVQWAFLGLMNIGIGAYLLANTPF